MECRSKHYKVKTKASFPSLSALQPTRSLSHSFSLKSLFQCFRSFKSEHGSCLPLLPVWPARPRKIPALVASNDVPANVSKTRESLTCQASARPNFSSRRRLLRRPPLPSGKPYWDVMLRNADQSSTITVESTSTTDVRTITEPATTETITR